MGHKKDRIGELNSFWLNNRTTTLEGTAAKDTVGGLELILMSKSLP